MIAERKVSILNGIEAKSPKAALIKLHGSDQPA